MRLNSITTTGIAGAVWANATRTLTTTLPAADSTANTDFTFPIGNKSDAAVTTVGTVASIIAYVKGVLNRTVRPTADVADNVTFADVIGNKSDAAVTTGGVVASILAYLKGILGIIGIASIQTFSIALDDPATSNTATINAVNTSRYFLIPLGWTTNNAAAGTNTMGRFILTNSTTVTATRVGGTGTLTGYGMIIEMKW